MSPLDNFYLAPDGKWYYSREQYLASQSNDGGYFEDDTGFWIDDTDDTNKGGELPSKKWDPSPYTWDSGMPEPDKPQFHVCTQFVDVGFHFTKMVCKECGKDK